MSARLFAIAPMLLVAFSGCLDGSNDHGAKAFDAIEAPTWAAGYSWTYDVTSSYHTTYSERGRPVTESESETETFSLTVVNDTLDLGGEPVYFVRASQRVDHPFLQGTIQAITKANLAVAGYAYESEYGGNRPREVPMPAKSYSGYYPPQPKDPCDGVVVMNDVRSDERFPGFKFPLDDGQSWTGSWGDGDSPEFTYTSRVRGITPVEVPAGIFPSVYMETEFEPVIPDDLDRDDFPLEFRVRSEAWYSPDVRYLTKMVVSAEAAAPVGQGGFGGGSFDFVSTMQLRDFELLPKASEPLEVVIQQEYETHAQRSHETGFRIVTDQAMPIEVGKGPVTVNMGLEKLDGFGGHDGRIPTRETVPDTVEIDHTTHEVVWMISRHGDWDGPWTETVGDQFTTVIEEPGRYSVQAHIRPIKCGETWRNYISGDLTTQLTQTFNVKIEPGLAATHKVGSVPIATEITGFTLEWVVKPSAAVVVDKGHVVLTSPHGSKRNLYASPYHEQYIFPEGDWRIEWVSGAPTVGDDVEITVKSIYDPWAMQ